MTARPAAPRLSTASVDQAPQVPDHADLTALRSAAADCTACDLHRDATQTVFGEGPPTARVVMVGEQPGDREDRAGAPFVGPAGDELDRALDAVGIDRDDVYVTNAVKHFKFHHRGKRRLHDTPDREEVAACLPWLRAEVQQVRPDLVVALGATAAKAVIHPGIRVTRDHGTLAPGPDGTLLTATAHPSSVIRVPDRDARHAARARLHDDLRMVATYLADGLAAALHHHTRERVYEQARELDVPGRSTMDKAALVVAVADAISG